jgi:hypothetical protein
VVEAEDWDGPRFQTSMNAAAICKAFETSRRREVLSFSHHAEVVALPPDQADALLDWAEETLPSQGKPRSTRELRSEVSKRRGALGSQPSGDTCRSPHGRLRRGTAERRSSAASYVQELPPLQRLAAVQPQGLVHELGQRLGIGRGRIGVRMQPPG